MKPTVAIVVPGLAHGGGVPAVASFLLRAAQRSGRYQVRVVSLSTGRNEVENARLLSPASWRSGPTVSIGQWQGVPFTHVGNWFGELEFQRYRRRAVLSRALAEADVVQVVAGFPAWANAVVNLGIPVALQVATLASVELRSRVTKPANLRDWVQRSMLPVTAMLDEQALRKVDAVQVENPWMLAHARRLCADRNVDLRYAPPGVDTTLFRPLPARGLNTDPYILLVGRLDDPRKRAGLLLEAYALLPAQVRAAVRLQLAGSAPPGPEFWTRVADLHLEDRISFAQRPTESQLVALYQAASVFALPSDEEGLGLVVLESMACGVPVVATKCGGPEGIIEDGKDGFLVSRDDPHTMAERLRHLLEDAEANIRVGSAARVTAAGKYDSMTTGQVFVDMWDRLLR